MARLAKHFLISLGNAFNFMPRKQKKGTRDIDLMLLEIDSRPKMWHFQKDFEAVGKDMNTVFKRVKYEK